MSSEGAYFNSYVYLHYKQLSKKNCYLEEIISRFIDILGLFLLYLQEYIP